MRLGVESRSMRSRSIRINCSATQISTLVFNQLMDASKVTDWYLSIDQVENVTRREFFSPLSKRAFVGPLPPDSPLARVFDAYNELTKHSSGIQIFPDVPSALKWLGIEALPETRMPVR